MRTFLLLLTLLLVGYNAYKPATLKTPLLLTLSRTVGMTPFSLQAKVKAAAEGREVCVVVEGPESMQSCRTVDGVTWWVGFTLRSGGDYAIYAVTEKYQTPSLRVQVVGIEEQP